CAESCSLPKAFEHVCPLSGRLVAPCFETTYVRFMISSLIVGGTGSLGLAIAKQRSKFGEQVVLTSRDAGRAEQAARDIGCNVRGIALDLSDPHGIADAL